MRRVAAAVGVLAVLAAAIVGMADENRDTDRDGAPSVGTGSAAARTDPATDLEQSIERARERQARVDGLADRLDSSP
ncbi:hypothetical protein [Aeromicrobium sp. Root472D3]|uniref:hypothetical protein n=1 Tax=Aeromicrobium sp. Root472D3 TaxID=1736540 RepID=UPI000A6BDF28|nr:hypothetical protein [Aeromicrobium sp. Root472D3]